MTKRSVLHEVPKFRVRCIPVNVETVISLVGILNEAEIWQFRNLSPSRISVKDKCIVFRHSLWRSIPQTLMCTNREVFIVSTSAFYFGFFFSQRFKITVLRKYLLHFPNKKSKTTTSCVFVARVFPRSFLVVRCVICVQWDCSE